MEGEVKTIGITGGIGAGKSVVSRVLRCNGEYVYDCDYEAKKLMEEDSEIKRELKGELGEDIYTAEGKINRSLMARKVFGDSSIRSFVNGLVHSAVRKDIEKKMEKHSTFFIESAILLSSGLANICDRIWVVTSPVEERLARVKLRDNADTGDIEKRMKTQENEINLLKDHNPVLITNDGKTPILMEILKLIRKENNKLIYTELC